MGTGVNRVEPLELERRKERFRRVFDYRPVDRMPVAFWYDDFSRHSLREQCENGGLQLEIMVENNNRLIELLDDDYIPMVRIWPGYVTIATMFGMEVFWTDDPNQPPGIKGSIVNSIEDIGALRKPDPLKDGLMPGNLEWLRHAAANLPPDIAITGIDLGGPLNTAKDLFDTNLLYTSFVDHPDEMHVFLDLVTEVQIECYAEVVKAIGGQKRLVSVDFDPVWAPEGKKGFVSDDVCASFSSSVFREFSIPYNERLFGAFGEGRLHNCGPHPSVDIYCTHSPHCCGINCSFKFTESGLTDFKEPFRQRGVVELNFDNDETPEEVVAGYERAANMLAPDVAAIPVLVFGDTWTDDEIRGTHQELKKIGREYARSMHWREG